MLMFLLRAVMPVGSVQMVVRGALSPATTFAPRLLAIVV
jgi:hypothetical protein